MAIKIQSTSQSVNSVKALIFGESGVGKTKLAATAPTPLILNAEGGLLSLAGDNLDSVDIKTVKDVMDVYEFITESADAKKYETIILDSVSDVAEVYLSTLKKKFTDPRQAYGVLADDVGDMIRAFRDIKHKHVYFIAKAGRVEDENGIGEIKSIMPGKTLTNGLPFFFDEVMALRIGKLEDKSTYRYLQTSGTVGYKCKDRSGALDLQEEPDLTKLFHKIIQYTNKK